MPLPPRGRFATGIKTGQDATCGLCLYYRRCQSCPIGDNCHGTPYSDYYHARKRLDKQGMLEAAEVMLYYLQHLSSGVGLEK